MKAYNHALEALNERHDALIETARQDWDNRVRLTNKARGLATAVEALKAGGREHSTSRLAIAEGAGKVRAAIGKSNETAYQEGLVEGLNIITANYPH